MTTTDRTDAGRWPCARANGATQGRNACCMHVTAWSATMDLGDERAPCSTPSTRFACARHWRHAEALDDDPPTSSSDRRRVLSRQAIGFRSRASSVRDRSRARSLTWRARRGRSPRADVAGALTGGGGQADLGAWRSALFGALRSPTCGVESDARSLSRDRRSALEPTYDAGGAAGAVGSARGLDRLVDSPAVHGRSTTERLRRGIHAMTAALGLSGYSRRARIAAGASDGSC